ncbi:MAG: alanine dehydrogenase, partial [Actinobacteria bacterium]|nr:alanine dehydrogenase [Actinomycetota bacterium]
MAIFTSVGVPTETKTDEHRVALTPDGVVELAGRGARVAIQSGAGLAAGFDDASYAAVGAEIVADAAAAWSCDLVVKVKEPQAHEFEYLRPDLTLFTYLHLAAYPNVATALTESGCTAFAYETVTDQRGALPLLAPMSEIAGRLATQMGAQFLAAHHGGRGVLLGGSPGVRPGRVVVIGAGNVGWNAARMAAGLEAEVSVIVDVAVDQGGCIATTRETTHSAPTFVEHDVIHYAVGNMPGAVPHTSTLALTNATLPYIGRLLDSGIEPADLPADLRA